MLLYLLVVSAVRRMGRGLRLARGAGLAGAALYVSSAEALQSHGAVYWPHSLPQPLLLGSCSCWNSRASRSSGGCSWGWVS